MGFGVQESPVYAFPTIYPPMISENEDPFPCRFGDYSKLSYLPWPRKRSSNLVSKLTVDVTSLTRDFERLKISGSSKKLGNKLTNWGLRVPSKQTDYSNISPYSKPPTPLTSPARGATPVIQPKNNNNGQISKAEVENTYEYISIFRRDIKDPSRILESKEKKAERRAISAPCSKCMRNKRITCDNNYQNSVVVAWRQKTDSPILRLSTWLS